MTQKQHQPGLPALSTESLPLGLAGLHAFHTLEVVQLSSTISDILQAQDAENRRATANAKLIPQLRAANQNLILATFGAQDSQAAAEAANQRQTEFLSMLAHELRNPLHPIIMANEMIGNITEVHPDLPTLHGIIQRQVEHLVRLVDDLLDASRASAGKILIETCTISLREVIKGAIETSQPVINGRRQHLELDFPAQAIFVEGDLMRLIQVFSNLLLNASKYTPEYGHITIRTKSSQHEVEVAVLDDGAGVPLDIQPLIFDLFMQGPRPQVSSPGGLGIGLSLVRTIAQLHGGTVRMYSEGSGTGSQFIVTLPRTTAPHLQRTTMDNGPEDDDNGPPRHVLLIEENADISEALCRGMEQHGHVVICCADGQSGLLEALEGSYDVIVCDIALSDIMGDVIARTLRQEMRTKLPYLIALTALTATERDQTYTNSFDHYLVKPVAISVLASALKHAH